MKERGNNKPNATGRSKTAPFVQVYYALMDSAAWAALTGNDIKLLLQLIRLSKGNNGYGHGGDDGRLFLAVRHAADVLNLAPGTIHKAFASLVEKGFVRAVQLGSFSVKVQVASTWRLTFQPTPWNNRGPSNEWRDWSPEQNSRCQKLDATVSKIDTAPPFEPDAVSEIDTVFSPSRSEAGVISAVSNIGTHLDIAKGGTGVVGAKPFNAPSFDPPFAGGIFADPADEPDLSGKVLAFPGSGTCEVDGCNGIFARGGRGMPKRFCSEKCRKLHENRRLRAKKLGASVERVSEAAR